MSPIDRLGSVHVRYTCPRGKRWVRSALGGMGDSSAETSGRGDTAMLSALSLESPNPTTAMNRHDRCVVGSVALSKRDKQRSEASWLAMVRRAVRYALMGCLRMGMSRSRRQFRVFENMYNAYMFHIVGLFSPIMYLASTDSKKYFNIQSRKQDMSRNSIISTSESHHPAVITSTF